MTDMACLTAHLTEVIKLQITSGSVAKCALVAVSITASHTAPPVTMPNLVAPGQTVPM